jgi:hypothetical protein
VLSGSGQKLTAMLKERSHTQKEDHLNDSM